MRITRPIPGARPFRGQPVAVQNRSGRFCIEPVRNAVMASAAGFKTCSEWAYRTELLETMAQTLLDGGGKKRKMGREKLSYPIRL